MKPDPKTPTSEATEQSGNSGSLDGTEAGADGRAPAVYPDLTTEQLDGMDLWNRDPAVFQERSRAIWAMLVRSAVAEIRNSRAIAIRLRELALSLEHAYHPDMRKIGAELRSRINGL